MLYNVTRTPEQLERTRWQEASKRAANRVLYGGHTVPPARLENIRLRARRWSANLRGAAIVMYGGKCVCCGEDRPETLTFDHMGQRSGVNERAGITVVLAINEFVLHGYPNTKYRVLCYNCNSVIGVFGYCPHQGRPISTPPKCKTTKANRRVKIEMIANYGGCCQICGEVAPEFLTINHINGGGRRHRKELGKGGVDFYKWLRRQGWPKGEYQLLCFNCNCGGLPRTGRALLNGRYQSEPIVM